MSESGHRWLYLLLNDRAAADPAVREAVGELRKRGHRVDVRALWEPGEALRCATEAAPRGYDALVAAGGDGTLNEVVNGVVAGGSKSAVGALAFGTANDFARATGIADLSPLEGLLLVAQGKATAIDVGKCNERFFLNVASGGFVAEVTAETSRDLKEWLGGLAYTLTGVVKYLSDEERQATVRTPREQWAGPLLAVTAANSRLAGGGYAVAPGAKLDDGLLNLHIIPSAGVLDMSDYLERLFLDDGLDASVGPNSAVPWLEIESPRELRVNLDGEPMAATRYRIEVLPRRLPFFLPEAAKELLTQPGERGALAP